MCKQRWICALPSPLSSYNHAVTYCKLYCPDSILACGAELRFNRRRRTLTADLISESSASAYTGTVSEQCSTPSI